MKEQSVVKQADSWNVSLFRHTVVLWVLISFPLSSNSIKCPLLTRPFGGSFVIYKAPQMSNCPQWAGEFETVWMLNVGVQRPKTLPHTFLDMYNHLNVTQCSQPHHTITWWAVEAFREFNKRPTGCPRIPSSPFSAFYFRENLEIQALFHLENGAL